MKKIFLFVVAALMLMACNSEEPTKAYEGIWKPMLLNESEEEIPDLFYVTCDSIKAIHCKDGIEYYQCHYKIIKKNVAELERCWAKKNGFPSSYWKAEVPMYIDEDSHLIILNFNPLAEIQQVYPNYSHLNLEKYEK